MDFHILETQVVAAIGSCSWMAPPGAFIGGALTALNPCVLAMVPLIIGVVGGYVQGEGAWKRSLGFSCLFVAGYALELALLFSVFAVGAPFLNGWWWRYVVAGICGALGAQLLLDLRLPAVVAMPAPGKWTGGLGIFVLGFLFGLVSIPCAGPVLMLLVGLVPQIGPAKAGSLLFLYGLGHAIFIFFAGVSVGFVQSLAESKGLNQLTRGLRKIAGLLILAVGYYFFRN